ncbi:MAG: cobalamin-binding protein [Anaerolineales bacterium]|nr:cobalamin-binding protein [Anaerolineales bacterium]
MAAPTQAPQPTNAPPTAEPSPTLEPTAEPVFPLTFTDGAGRSVTLKTAPARIVSLTPSNTEILFAVGAGGMVVGNTSYCDYPPEAAGLPAVGGFTGESISVETIVSLAPDLVLANDTQQEIVIAALGQAGIAVAALKGASFDDVYANIELVGKITGHAGEAAAVVEWMKARTTAVTEAVSAVPAAERLSVFWEVWDEPLMTAGPGTFAGQMIGLAGGVNIFAELSGDYPTVSAEEVVKRNPAVIMGPDYHGDKLTAELLGSRPGWGEIDAVVNNRVYLIDGNICSRPGPRLVDALEDVAEALYPELFH